MLSFESPFNMMLQQYRIVRINKLLLYIIFILAYIFYI